MVPDIIGLVPELPPGKTGSKTLDAGNGEILLATEEVEEILGPLMTNEARDQRNLFWIVISLMTKEAPRPMERLWTAHVLAIVRHAEPTRPHMA